MFDNLFKRNICIGEIKFSKIFLFCLSCLSVFVLGVGVVSAYWYRGYKWSGTSVSYYINSSFTSSVRTSIRSADATWDASGSKFRFYYSGTTSRNPNVWAGVCDAYNDVGHYNNGNTGVIASAYTGISGTAIIETDITVNTYYSWSTSGASGSYDIQNTLTHEFGHWLRLEDRSSTGSPTYCGSSSESTMCGVIYKGETRKRSLATDDKNGIKAIYGI